MPVSVSSRYYGLPVYNATDDEGQTHPTVAIRPPAPPPPGATEYHHMVSGVETIEYLAWRFYGSSAAWWRIAEANPLVFPLDWPTGAVVNIADAGDVGLIQRTRRF